MVEPPWKVISPQGLLHYLPDRSALTALAKQEEIKVFDMEFQVGAPDKHGVQTVGNCTDPEHAGNWTALFRLVWLRHISTGRVVFVHGNRSAWRARAIAAEPGLGFVNDDNFRKLCRGAYNKGAPYAKWALLKDAPVNAEAIIPHVQSGPYAPPALARQHWIAEAERTRAGAQAVLAEAEKARADQQTARAEAAECKLELERCSAAHAIEDAKAMVVTRSESSQRELATAMATANEQQNEKLQAELTAKQREVERLQTMLQVQQDGGLGRSIQALRPGEAVMVPQQGHGGAPIRMVRQTNSRVSSNDASRSPPPAPV
jgi:hypothetical protein